MTVRKAIRHGFVMPLCVIIALAAGSRVSGQTLEEARGLHREGELERALAAYLAVAEEFAESDPATAATAFNNACVIQTGRGELQEALASCEAASTLRRQVDDDLRRARTLNNLGLVLQQLGRLDEADLRFREALTLNRSIGEKQGEVINLANLGVDATLAGRYSDALVRLAEVQRRTAQAADQPWAVQQDLLARVNRAVVLEKLGAYREALKLLQGVLETGESLGAAQHAELTVVEGVLYRNLGDSVQAEQAFRRGVEEFEKLGDGQAESNAWLNLGLVYELNLGQPTTAESAYRRSVAVAEETGNRSDQMQALVYLGRMLAGQDRNDEAQRVFQRSLDLANEVGSAEGRWASLAGLGLIAEAEEEFESALNLLREAIEILEAARRGVSQQILASGSFGDKREVYGAAVRVLVELHRLEPGRGHDAAALAVVQRAKARDLIDALGPDRAPPPSESFDFGGGSPILEVFWAGDRLFEWLIDDESLVLVEVAKPEELSSAVKIVHSALAAGGTIPEDQLAALSAGLLLPLAERLQEITALRIAPDGVFHYLPFDLLRVPSAPASQSAVSFGGRLVETVPVSYLLSASSQDWFARRPSRALLRLVGFADPDLSVGRTEAGTPLELIADRFGLESLPAARDEIANAQVQLGGRSRLRVGVAANEQEVRQLEALRPQIVHFATHAVADERSRRGAAILLSPTLHDDGVLYPSEIAELELHNDLTVLSACSTALGVAAEGQALSSLTGAFLLAGSSAVVATLWDVDDAASAVFMEQFYYHLGQDKGPAEALWQAKRRLLGDPRWADPALWSAYVLVGDPGAGKPDWFGWPWSRSLVLASLVAAFLALTAIWLAIRRRSQTPTRRHSS